MTKTVHVPDWENVTDEYGNRFYIIIGTFRGQVWIVEDENYGRQLQFPSQEHAQAYLTQHQEVWSRENAYSIHGVR